MKRVRCWTLVNSTAHLYGFLLVLLTLVVLNLTTAGRQCYGFPIAVNPEIGQQSRSAAFDGTNYLVAFQEKIDQARPVSVQFVSLTGTLVGSKVALDLAGGAPQVAFDGTNYFLITTEDTTSPTYIYGQLMSKAGAKVDSPVYVTTGGSSIATPAMTFDGTNYFVVWNDSRTLRGQFVSPAGQLVGSPITVCSGTGPSDDVPEVYNVISGGTNILVAWVDGRRGESCGGEICELDIYGQLVQKSGSGTPGSLSGSNFAINQNEDWSDMFTVGLGFDGTNYLVAWNDMAPESKNARLYAQLISSSGAAVGGVISIGTPTQNQYRPGPMIAFDGANYLLTWIYDKNDKNHNGVSDANEGTCLDSYGQFISPLGQLQGPTFLVSGGAKNQFSYPVYGGGKYLLVTNSFDQFDGATGTVSGAFISPAQASQTGTPKISASPASVNVGKVRVGDAPEQAITIRNTGTLDLAITRIEITGTNLDEFNQTNDCTTIMAGDSCTITVTFAPALPYGAKNATVVISSNDFRKPSLNVKLRGTASPPKLSISPISVNFGSVKAGDTSSTKTVVISNTGVSDLVISDISIIGLNAAEFDQEHGCATIAAGGSCTVTGTFTPASIGSKTATLAISSNDPAKAVANMKLVAKALPREFQITVLQPEGGGQITLRGQNTSVTKVLVKENANAYLTIKPAKGYHVSAVMVDGDLIFDGTTINDANFTEISDSGVYQYAFTAISEPHTLAAQCAPEGTGNLVLTGIMGSGYRTASGGSTRVHSDESGAPHVGAVDRQVDKIVAIQSDRGHLEAYSMENSRSSAINSDGTFSITLDIARDWLLVLMDSTAVDKKDQFVGYVALNTGTAESLLQVPASTSTVSSLDLGEIAASGDVGQSQNPVDAGDFTMTSSQLLNLAKNDDAFKSVKNFVINYDSASGVYYTLRPDFRWRGSYASINGVFQNPAEYTYSSYSFQLDSNTASVTMDKICGANGQAQLILDLVPPANVTTTDARTFGPDNPMSSANVTCAPTADGSIEAQDYTGSGFCAGVRGEDNHISQSYTAGLSGTIPTGYWLYHEGGQQKGQFDVSVASPLRGDNTLKGVVPSAKVNTDGTGKITSVDIKWYSWDELTSQYVQLTDISILRYLIGTGDVYFDNSFNGPRRYESVHLDPAVDTSAAPSQYTWYYGAAGPSEQQVTGFGIFYESGGIGFFFEFFRPN